MKFLILLSALLSVAYANAVVCKVCEEAVTALDGHSDQIKTALDNVCERLNGTAKVATCKLAVNTAIKKIDTMTPEQVCDDVHLCGNSTYIPELVQPALLLGGVPMLTVQEPELDTCSVCQTVVGLAQTNSKTIENGLDALCGKITNSAEKAACDGAVATLVNVLNSQDAKTVCTEIKLCQALQKVELDACSVCQTVVGLAQTNAKTIENGLDALCAKITNSAEKAACDGAVATLVNVLN